MQDNDIRERLERIVGPVSDFVEECDYLPNKVQIVARAPFPTEFGDFTLYGIYDGPHDKEHVAVTKGEVAGKARCPVRIHSECHTGDVWHSLRCDCRAQLDAALAYIGGQPNGAILYMRQEGRGIGLLNKIKAYQLQDRGLDTVEANQYLGYPADARDYDAAARIIDLLGIRSVALLSNNPDKIAKLRQSGITIEERIPLQIEATQHSRNYLDTKRRRMGHILE